MLITPKAKTNKIPKYINVFFNFDLSFSLIPSIKFSPISLISFVIIVEAKLISPTLEKLTRINDPTSEIQIEFTTLLTLKIVAELNSKKIKGISNKPSIKEFIKDLSKIVLLKTYVFSTLNKIIPKNPLK